VGFPVPVVIPGKSISNPLKISISLGHGSVAADLLQGILGVDVLGRARGVGWWEPIGNLSVYPVTYSNLGGKNSKNHQNMEDLLT